MGCPVVVLSQTTIWNNGDIDKDPHTYQLWMYLEEEHPQWCQVCEPAH